MSSFIQRLTRRKHVTIEDTELPRVLNTFDLTLLGIGSTVGVGFYVLAGEVARNVAGPAVIISFLIAAMASVFAGLCYAEFGARVPKAGSAYVYSYVCVGEFVAFVIGWNLLLEYVIGTASVARGYSGYVDGLANNTMSERLTEVMPIHVDFLSPYPDFLSFGLVVFLSVLLSLGVKESSIMNSICTAITLLVVTYTIIAMATKADIKNWTLTPQEINETCPEDDEKHKDWGNGGFAPYGFAGIMRGAATCFFGFVGFDCIATTGEEAIKPERSIPVSIGLSLLFVFLAYFGMSSTITLALPYCLQDAKAPLVSIFEGFHWHTSMWIVSIGALFGFSASLFGILLPLPRVIYAMAEDGMVFRFLSKINKRFRTPAIATIVSGIFAGLMAMFFHLEALVDMMSIGTLLAYTIVALSVIMLRYSNLEMRDRRSEYTLLKTSYADDDDPEPNKLLESGETSRINSNSSVYAMNDYVQQMFNVKRVREPTDLTSSLVSYATLVFCLLSAILALLLVVLQDKLFAGETQAIVGIVIMSVLTLISVIVIAFQPQSNKLLSFKVPLVPWIPALSTVVNLYLMFNLSSGTWIRFGIWMAIGILMYFGYGIWHSNEGKKEIHPKYGIENPVQPDIMDEKNVSHLYAIPEIEVHPATPMPSEPSTPEMSQKVEDNMLQKSSLVTGEIYGTNSQVTSRVSICESDVESVLASFDLVIESEVNSHLGSDASVSVGDIEQMRQQKAGSLKSNEDVQSRKLPPLPTEEMWGNTILPKTNSFDERDQPVDGEIRGHGESTSSSDPGYESLQSVLAKKELITHDESIGLYNDPGYETLEDVLNEKDKLSEKDTESVSEDSNRVQSAIARIENGSEVESGSEISMDSEPKAAGTVEPSYATVKKAKPKLEPLLISSETATYSNKTESPTLENSTPSPPLPPPQVSLCEDTAGSVPSTSEAQSYTHNALQRNSSFDSIPPSNPDSPLAHRFGDKFVIVPVNEPSSEIDDKDVSQILKESSLPLLKQDESSLSLHGNLKEDYGDKESDQSDELETASEHSEEEAEEIKMLSVEEEQIAAADVSDSEGKPIEAGCITENEEKQVEERNITGSEMNQGEEEKISECEDKPEEAQDLVKCNDHPAEAGETFDPDDDSLESALANAGSSGFINFLPSPTIIGNIREFQRLGNKDNTAEQLDPVIEEDEIDVPTSRTVESEEISIQSSDNGTKESGETEISKTAIDSFVEREEESDLQNTNTEMLPKLSSFSMVSTDDTSLDDSEDISREDNTSIEEKVKSSLVGLRPTSENVSKIRSLFGD